jgi:hypothetical protein
VLDEIKSRYQNRVPAPTNGLLSGRSEPGEANDQTVSGGGGRKRDTKQEEYLVQVMDGPYSLQSFS